MVTRFDVLDWATSTVIYSPSITIPHIRVGDFLHIIAVCRQPACNRGQHASQGQGRVGAGQLPGEGLGNGRAVVLRFAQEGSDDPYRLI